MSSEAVNHALKESIALNAIDVHRDDGACGDIVANMASIKLVDRVSDGFELAIKIDINMVYWSELPPDILELLLWKTATPRDFINFSLVSKMWNSLAKEIFIPFRHQLPLIQFFPMNNPLPMLLQSYTEDPHSNTYSLYCLANNRTYNSFYAPELTNKWLVGSMGGWLGTVDTKNLQMNLINPLTHKKMSLPPVYTIPNPINDDSFGIGTNDIFWFVNKVVMLSDPEKDPDDCIVVALVSNARTIAYCKIKDKKWKKIENTGAIGVVDIIKHNNMLYAVSYGADLYVIDFTCNIKVTLVAQFCKYPRPADIQGYLMGSSGELLLLLRHVGVSGPGDINMAMTHKFEIFKLKEVPSYSCYYYIYIMEDRRNHEVEGLRYQWSEVESIGDKTVFVGRNGTMWFQIYILDAKQIVYTLLMTRLKSICLG